MSKLPDGMGCIICGSEKFQELSPELSIHVLFFALGCATTLLNAGVVFCEPHHLQIHRAMRVFGFDESGAKPAPVPGALPS